MMVSVFGTPSPLCSWVLCMAERAAQVIYSNVSVLSANTLEELGLKLSSRAYKPVVLHSDTPKSDFVDMFLNLPGPLALVTEPARVVTLSAMAARSLDVQTALRFTSRSLYTLSRLTTRRNVWKIDWTIGSVTMSDFADAMCMHLFTEANTSQCLKIREQIAIMNQGSTNVREAVKSFAAKYFQFVPGAGTVGEQIVSELIHVADQFEALGSSGVCTLTWPPGVFVNMADLSYVDGPIDMIGPARVLVGGHALSVPMGRWEANVEILISQNNSGNRLLSDVFAEDRQVSVGLADLPSDGLFAYKLQFECCDPYYPIIIRLAILEGAIEGTIDLRRVRLYKIS